jgi:hypothetical protein
MRQAGAEWDQPEAFDALLADSSRRELFGDFLRYSLTTPRAVSYLGWSRYLHYRDLARLDVAWGWKDPRSTFTLPFWLDIFPDARVLHIYRNGVDVANSLHMRSQAGHAHFLTWKRLHRRLAFSWWNQLSPKLYVRNFSLSEGFALWELYTRRADEHIAALPVERVRQVQYEAFLADPLPVIQDLCDFVGVTVSPDVIQRAIATIKPGRARAYEQDAELRAFYEQVRHSPQMVAYGY